MAITRVSTINELKQLFTEILINKSSKVSKVSNQSVFNGIAFGVAKVAQKALKDVAIVESNLFPDSAFGVTLDAVAENYGIAARLGASESSTYVRVVGDSGTVYTAGVQIFSGSGINFDLEENLTLGAEGYGYAKIRSQPSGSQTNVPALAINTVSPVPVGHKFVSNEYAALYGRDLEDDRLFRLRIKDAGNLASRGTLAYITQTFIKINSNVLEVRYQGLNDLSQPTLAVVTQNGIDLTTNELDDLKSRAEEFLNLVDLNPLTGVANIEIKNIEYEAIDISARVQLNPLADPDTVRQDLQISISKYLDFRFWEPGSRFEWDDVLQLVKDHPSIEYVPDTFFFPNQDIDTDPVKLPRIRGFLLLDLQGNIISNNSNTLNPIYYPVQTDFSFQATVLSSI